MLTSQNARHRHISDMIRNSAIADKPRVALCAICLDVADLPKTRPPSLPPMCCYTPNLFVLTSKNVGQYVGEPQKLGSAGATTLGREAWLSPNDNSLPMCVITSNLVIPRQRRKWRKPKIWQRGDADPLGRGCD